MGRRRYIDTKVSAVSNTRTVKRERFALADSRVRAAVSDALRDDLEDVRTVSCVTRLSC